MNFRNNTDTHIELNLDNIFNENGYINPNDEHYYKCNGNVISIKLIRTKDTAIKIGNGFLYYCKNLTTIDLSSLLHVIQIGDSFLSCCSNLATIDLSPLLHVTQIGDYFLSRCSNLTTIDLSALSQVAQIGNCFLSWCSNLTTIDLSGLSQVTQIGNYFLFNCSKLTTIDLSPLSQVTQIGNFFLSWCSNLTTIDLSALSQVTQIGYGFLYNCSNLTTIDLSALQHVTQIGDCFLYRCSNLTTIDLSGLSQVTKIGDWFLSGCSNLTIIDLSALSHVTQIGNYFLYNCSNLTTIDLSGLSQVTQIGEGFLYNCSKLTTIICDNDIIIQKIKDLNSNIEIKSKSGYLFSTCDKDIENIKLDKQYAKKVLDWLNIHYTKKNSHNVLIKKIEKERKKHNERMTEEELDECINTEEIFSMESLENIHKSRLIKVNKINDKYYCFDVIALRNFIFQKQNEKHKNPYTNTEFAKEDIDKILSVDIRKIQYFSNACGIKN